MNFLDFLTGRNWISRRHPQLESHPNIGELAQQIKPVAAWGDVVLPDGERQILDLIATQIRRPAWRYDRLGLFGKRADYLGNSVLFTGGSIRDRTMAAEMLASHLQLDLYRIDLGAMVSKYISETEKNLSLVLDAAEARDVILFFDEADALFGKRSEVMNSHDRFANIEVNILLERIQRFRGLAIFATNQRTNLDEACIRRVNYLVELPDPNSA